LAEQQWGHLTARQLRACGMSRSAISRAVASRRLRRVFPGVYAVGHRSPAPQARWAAALLYCGEDSALSGLAAAANLGLVVAPPAIMDVIVPRRVKPQPGLRTHTLEQPLARDEVVVVNGLRTTTTARTLLDLAAGGIPIERMVANAVARRMTTVRALRAYAVRRAGSRGAARLRASVDGEITRSKVEREFVGWLRSRGLPIPSMNCEIGALTVDGLWSDAGLVVEIDTFATHGTPHSFEDDRSRDGYLLARGRRTIRVTPQRWRHDGDRLERDLRAALAHQ
jgi:very-short-patch-repair endonuclease